MTLWDWLFELQQNWKVVLFGIQSVNKADVSCVHVYACVSAFSFFFFFFYSETLLWENEEQDTVSLIGVSESHCGPFFSVDDSSILKVEAFRFSLPSVLFFPTTYGVIF
jgi:hypothetical protein